jgi:hypothetical protein
MHSSHRKTHHAKSILLSSGIAVLVGLAILARGQILAKSSYASIPIMESGTFKEQRNQIYHILNDQGPETAIHVVKQGLEDKKIILSQCHGMLHAVGHVAYYKDKDLSHIITLVDETCYAAFLHGVEAEIVIEEPDQFIQKLGTLCQYVKKKDSSISCFHGAGHAFMQDSNDVKVSLKRCDGLSITQINDLDNCYGGVFSEFGNRVTGFDTDTGEHTQGPPLIKFAYTAHPIEYCETVERKYQAACARQIVKIKYQENNMKANLAECQLPGLSQEMTGVCINISSTFFAETELYKDMSISLPVEVTSLSKKNKEEYIRGTYTALRSYTPAKNLGIAESFCKQFTSTIDKSMCNRVMGNPS